MLARLSLLFNNCKPTEMFGGMQYLYSIFVVANYSDPLNLGKVNSLCSDRCLIIL